MEGLEHLLGFSWVELPSILVLDNCTEGNKISKILALSKERRDNENLPVGKPVLTVLLPAMSMYLL